MTKDRWPLLPTLNVTFAMSTKLRTCAGCNVALGRSEFSKNQVRGTTERIVVVSS